jgi:hypothetical protein
MIAIANGSRSGLIDCKPAKPQSDKFEDTSSYIERIDDNCVGGGGNYRNR